MTIDDPDDPLHDEPVFYEPEWVARAREAIDLLLETLELNPVTNEAGLVIPRQRNHSPVKWFSSLGAIRANLLELAESIAEVAEPYGREYARTFGTDDPLDTPNLVDGLLEERGVVTFFESLREPEGLVEPIFDPKQCAAPQAGSVFRIDIADINAELIAHLARNPSKMYELHPRKFEELIAELFRDKGYAVELTPLSGDGGRDLICTQKAMHGTMLVYVECKRHAPSNPVGVSIVRSLFGVVAAEGASQGVVATTSHFTRGAKSFHAQNQYRLALKDFDALKEWLARYRTS